MAKILIVEDEYVIAKGMHGTLAGWGYQITGMATTGEEAIASVERDEPDLVLMDIVLKGDMDGVAAAAQIGERFDIPIIYVTAHGSDGTVQRAKLTAPFCYIVKPFSDKTLHSNIEISLYRHGIEQARERRIRRLESLSERLMAAQDDECRRIAYELHEQLGQELTTLKIRLQMLEAGGGAIELEPCLQDTLAVAARALERVRGMSLELAPLQLENMGLNVALRTHCAQQAKAAGLTIHVDAPEPEVRPPEKVERTCFRLLQEALAAILRYAHANTVWVCLRQSVDELALSVRDNGIGFDVGAVREDKARGGLGLLSMEQRAKHAGGRIEILSTPGAGTEVKAVFSLARCAGPGGCVRRHSAP